MKMVKNIMKKIIDDELLVEKFKDPKGEDLKKDPKGEDLKKDLKKDSKGEDLKKDLKKDSNHIVPLTYEYVHQKASKGVLKDYFPE